MRPTPMQYSEAIEEGRLYVSLSGKYHFVVKNGLLLCKGSKHWTRTMGPDGEWNLVNEEMTILIIDAALEEAS